MFQFFSGFSSSKCKANCKMAATRAKQLMNKTMAQRQVTERDACRLIVDNKLEKARIKAEQTIQHENMEKALDVLETMLELLATRVELVAHSRECPTDMYVCISSIAYSSERVDNPELVVVYNQLSSKFGKKFMHQMKDNELDRVHPMVIGGFSIRPPSPVMIEMEMMRIAQQFHVQYIPAVSIPEPVPLPRLQIHSSGTTTPATSHSRNADGSTPTHAMAMSAPITRDDRAMSVPHASRDASFNPVEHPRAPPISAPNSVKRMSIASDTATPTPPASTANQQRSTGGYVNRENTPDTPPVVQPKPGGMDDLMARFERLKKP